MKKYSKKGLEKRKEERKDFPEFFQKHTERIKSGGLYCAECGTRLKGNVSEIAHVLPKSYFKSVSTSDDNVLYLCGMFSENQCHSIYDNSPQETVKQMRIFSRVQEIFQKLLPQITEKLNYKHYDLWQP